MDKYDLRTSTDLDVSTYDLPLHYQFSLLLILAEIFEMDIRIITDYSLQVKARFYDRQNR
jgi:hypothetical protein